MFLSPSIINVMRNLALSPLDRDTLCSQPLPSLYTDIFENLIRAFSGSEDVQWFYIIL